jgi:hypothetical protein
MTRLRPWLANDTCPTSRSLAVMGVAQLAVAGAQRGDVRLGEGDRQRRAAQAGASTCGNSARIVAGDLALVGGLGQQRQFVVGVAGDEDIGAGPALHGVAVVQRDAAAVELDDRHVPGAARGRSASRPIAASTYW